MKLSKFINHKFLLFLGTFSKLIEVVLELFLPIFMGLMIDEGIKKNNTQTVYLMLFLILLFATLGYLTTVFAHFLTAKVSQNYHHNLRLALYEKVLNMKYEDRKKYSTSSLLNRLNNDTLQTSNALAMTMRILSRAPFLMIGSIVALYITSPNVSYVSMIVLPLTFVFVLILVLMLLRFNQRLQKEMDRSSSLVKETLDGIQVIKSFHKEEPTYKNFKNQNQLIVNLQRMLGYISTLGSPVVSLVLNLALVFMIYISAIDINLGSMTQGQVLSMINYTTQLILSMLGILNLIILYAKAFTSNERIKEILNYENENTLVKTESLDDIETIEFKNVSFAYKGQKEFLKNINFKLTKGQSYGMIGLTGSGKSTILKMLVGFLKPTEGEILINNRPMSTYSLNDIRRLVGYVSQENYLFQGTVKDNLSMGFNYEDESIIQALYDSEYPMNQGQIQNEVKKMGLNFSGGQRQRLNIARALTKKPSILLLDDALSSLDNQTILNLKNNLLKHKDSWILMMSSSKLSHIDFVDEWIVISQNEIETVGKKDEVLKTSPLVQKLSITQHELEEVSHV